ncbi:free fatty acid receptor 4-like [Trichomycterus rosablanca]|uniref:free fatty acid receptor 4-like n=1 Tax=Trichomycterus rosablanca TaxID=2290929 RepID=UPI002F35F44B
MLPLTHSAYQSAHPHTRNFTYFTFFSELQNTHWLVTMTETLVLMMIFVVSVVGNLGAFILVIQERRLTNNLLFTLNLFLADLLFVSTVPLVISVRWTKAWKLGSVACHMVMYFISLSGTVTITTLSAISIERLLAILKMEMTPSLNPRWAACVLFLIWFFSAVGLLPLSLFSRVVPVVFHDQREVHICTLIWPHLTGEIVWNAMFIILVYLLPGASIVISYSKILQIRQQSKRRFHTSTSPRHEQSSTVSRQDYKLFRTLLVLMTSFFVMWAPVFIFSFLILVNNFKAHISITSSMFFWVLTFTMANSALNPVLYSLYKWKHRWQRVCCAMEVTPG